MSFIEFKNVSRIYKSGDSEIRAIDNVNFEIEKEIYSYFRTKWFWKIYDIKFIRWNG